MMHCPNLSIQAGSQKHRVLIGKSLGSARIILTPLTQPSASMCLRMLCKCSAVVCQRIQSSFQSCYVTGFRCKRTPSGSAENGNKLVCWGAGQGFSFWEFACSTLLMHVSEWECLLVCGHAFWETTPACLVLAVQFRCVYCYRFSTTFVGSVFFD